MLRVSMLIVALFTAGCGSDLDRAGQAERRVHMWDLVFANPERDARRAIAAGDRRVLTVSGFSTEAPGTDLTMPEAQEEFGLIHIGGTGDYYRWPGEQQLNENARRYAATYNRIILQSESEEGPALE
jgi:hypothetical protein